MYISKFRQIGFDSQVTFYIEGILQYILYFKYHFAKI